MPEELLRQRPLALRVVGRYVHRQAFDRHPRAHRQQLRPRGSHATAVAGVRDQERLVSPQAPGGYRHENVDPARRDVLWPVDALVADDLAAVRRARRTEDAGCAERPQQRLYLPLDLLPDAALGRLEHDPARAALDAAHQQQATSLRREQPLVGARRRPASQRPERQRARTRRAQRLQRIDAVRGERVALGVGAQMRRARARPQQDLLVRPGLPRRALLVDARERAGHGAAVGKRFGAAAQPIVRSDAREAEQRVVRAEIEFAQAPQRILAGLPGRRRIDDQHRASFPAQPVGDQQHARAEVTVAGGWRNADEMHVVGAGQREQARSGRRRADQVVVGEGSAVVAVGIRIDVPDRMARSGPERALRPHGRHGAAHAHQRRLLQRRSDVARRVRRDRQAAEDLLVFDVLGARRAHALHHEVEAIRLVRTDIVVIDGGAQRFARARAQGYERERLARAARQRDAGGCAAVHHADDHGLAPAVLEELLDGIGQRARLPEATEDVVELRVAAHCDGAIDGAAQRAPDECSNGGGKAGNGALGARPLRHVDTALFRIPQTRAPAQPIPPACAARKLAQLLVFLAALRHHSLMHSTSGRWRLGLALALTTAVCWGLLPIALEVTLEGMDAWTITWYRFATAAVVLGAYLAWRRRMPLRRPLTRRGWMLYAVALVCLVANYVSYLLSLELTSPTVAQVLIQLAPMFLLFGGVIVFRERFARVQWAGSAVLVAGLLVFFHDRYAEVFALQTRLGLGVAVMLFSALAWSVYAMAQKQLLTQLASGQVLLLLYAGAVPLLFPPARLAQVLELNGLQLGMLVFCCANTVVAYGCFAEALEHWEVSRVSAVVTLAPVFTVLGIQAAAWLWPAGVPAESLSGWNLLGASLVVVGSMTTALAAQPRRP